MPAVEMDSEDIQTECYIDLDYLICFQGLSNTARMQKLFLSTSYF